MPLNDRQKYLLGLGPNPEAVADNTSANNDQVRQFESNQAKLKALAQNLSDIGKSGRRGELSNASQRIIASELPDIVKRAVVYLDAQGVSPEGAMAKVDNGYYRANALFKGIKVGDLGPFDTGSYVRDRGGSRINISNRNIADSSAFGYLNKLPSSNAGDQSPLRSLFHEITHSIDDDTNLGFFKDSNGDVYDEKSSEILAQLASLYYMAENGGITKENYDIGLARIKKRIAKRQATRDKSKK
jgi:hypothetical protein